MAEDTPIQTFDLYAGRSYGKKFRVARFEAPDAEAPTSFASWVDGGDGDDGDGGGYVKVRRKKGLGTATGGVAADTRNPYVFEDSAGKYSLTGTREGGLTENSSYFVLVMEDGQFHALPIEEWYSLRPTIRHRVLTTEEAEQEMKDMRTKKATVRERWLMHKFKVNEESEGVDGDADGLGSAELGSGSGSSSGLVKTVHEGVGAGARPGGVKVKVSAKPDAGVGFALGQSAPSLQSILKREPEEEDMAEGDDITGVFEQVSEGEYEGGSGAGAGGGAGGVKGTSVKVDAQLDLPVQKAQSQSQPLALSMSTGQDLDLDEIGSSSEEDDDYDPDNDFDADLLFGGMDSGSGSGMGMRAGAGAGAGVKREREPSPTKAQAQAQAQAQGGPGPGGGTGGGPGGGRGSGRGRGRGRGHGKVGRPPKRGRM